MTTTQAHAVRPAERVRLPSELSETVPRDVRLTAGGIVVAVVAVALAIGALVSTILMSVAYTRGEAGRQLREREGVFVQADVAQVALRRGENPRRIVTYRYEVNGRQYTGRTVLRRSDRREIRQHTAMPISYIRSHPETSWTVGYEPDGFPLFVIPLTTASLLAAAVAIAWGVRRQWILLSEGRVAQARITGSKKIHKNKRRMYSVAYEFQTLSGSTHFARYDDAKTPPAIGTTISVVYHRDKPQWSSAYPFELVRPSRAPSRQGARR